MLSSPPAVAVPASAGSEYDVDDYSENNGTRRCPHYFAHQAVRHEGKEAAKEVVAYPSPCYAENNGKQQAEAPAPQEQSCQPASYGTDQ